TFLPEEVVDGLYAAVALAGLEVSNLTLEPIAAIQVAIPENFRLLNIALIDVGAGASDICITKDGSIIGYGMLPKAGDEITERLIKEYLVDFDTAEKIKLIGPKRKSLTYKDIMGISHKITPQEVYETVDSVVEDITSKIAEQIIELNGDHPVSATFVVGGGGKIPGFTQKLAAYLDLPEERVALRGEEVLGFVDIQVEGVKKDPLLVTPIGICLNFYNQKNQFIFVNVNGNRVKLYDNDKLTVFDAALAYGLSNEDVFPKRGQDLTYTMNGKQRFVRGEQGEPAKIVVNGRDVGMNHEIQAGDQIMITSSTVGEAASAVLRDVAHMDDTITFIVNDREITCPRLASVDGTLVSEFYEINEGDRIEILNHYTLSQLMQFMDIETPHEVFVNGARAGADTKVYENFNVAWIDREEIYKAERFVTEEQQEIDDETIERPDMIQSDQGSLRQAQDSSEKSVTESVKAEAPITGQQDKTLVDEWIEQVDANKNQAPVQMQVTVNGTPVTLTGKPNYVFVDIFDKYPFDLKSVKGTTLVQKIDGKEAEHFSALYDGANIELYWKE
ncbi:MAG: cell division protein FtsA, partial [Clostridiales bacterium]|nr:cell division protein FtsA [Clostridiales bacterium]